MAYRTPIVICRLYCKGLIFTLVYCALMTYKKIVIDIVVPMVFCISLYMLLKIFTNVPLIREALYSIGLGK